MRDERGFSVIELFVTLGLMSIAMVIAFGFIGVFLGPVLLALGFALVKEWATAS